MKEILTKHTSLSGAYTLYVFFCPMFLSDSFHPKKAKGDFFCSKYAFLVVFVRPNFRDKLGCMLVSECLREVDVPRRSALLLILR